MPTVVIGARAEADGGGSLPNLLIHVIRSEFVHSKYSDASFYLY